MQQQRSRSEVYSVYATGPSCLVFFFINFNYDNKYYIFFVTGFLLVAFKVCLLDKVVIDIQGQIPGLS